MTILLVSKNRQGQCQTVKINPHPVFWILDRVLDLINAPTPQFQLNLSDWLGEVKREPQVLRQDAPQFHREQRPHVSTSQPNQDKNINTLFGNANFDRLPQDCWQGPALDGSIWIYERAAEDGATMLVRHNPINPDEAVKNFPITKERLLLESNLTTFALLIWTLSNIDDTDLY